MVRSPGTRIELSERNPQPESTLRHIPVLDGIRGVAVLAVVLLHAGVLPWGWIGVDIFFVLSGFLITGILLDAKAAGHTGWPTYVQPFYIRRSLRILPLAYAALVFVFLVAPWFGVLGRVPAREQVWYWAYISNWWFWPRSDASWQLSHFWSLAVEEQFYWSWPWIVLATSRHGLGRISVALFVLAPVLRLLLFLVPHPAAIGHMYENVTPLRMDGLVAGALLAVVARGEGGLGRWRAAATRILPFAALVFTMIQLLPLPDGIAYVVRYTVLTAAIAASIALVLVNPTSVTHQWLSAHWLRWLGTVSYGIYVIHFPITLWLHSHRAGIVTSVVGTLALTLALAATSWYAFERPILALKRRLAVPAPRATGTGRLDG
jgi:peptidoglycan/LPS O-acetylase OafA/YrhL